jgi:SAM-dependent methyltransferase
LNTPRGESWTWVAFAAERAAGLRRRFPGCELIGIEMLERAAEIAAPAYTRVIVDTLENIDLEREGLLPGSLDAIVAADVLEHMYNPWQALERLRPLLATGGALYVSLPNLRNLNVLSELAEGRFRYAGAGILDITHVRFFTRAEAVSMLEQTGFRIEDIRINPDASLASLFEGRPLHELTQIRHGRLALSDLTPHDALELMALQLFFRAVPVL